MTTLEQMVQVWLEGGPERHVRYTYQHDVGRWLVQLAFPPPAPRCTGIATGEGYSLGEAIHNAAVEYHEQFLSGRALSLAGPENVRALAEAMVRDPLCSLAIKGVQTPGLDTFLAKATRVLRAFEGGGAANGSASAEGPSSAPAAVDPLASAEETGAGQ